MKKIWKLILLYITRWTLRRSPAIILSAFSSLHQTVDPFGALSTPVTHLCEPPITPATLSSQRSIIRTIACDHLSSPAALRPSCICLAHFRFPNNQIWWRSLLEASNILSPARTSVALSSLRTHKHLFYNLSFSFVLFRIPLDYIFPLPIHLFTCITSPFIRTSSFGSKHSILARTFIVSNMNLRHDISVRNLTLFFSQNDRSW